MNLTIRTLAITFFSCALSASQAQTSDEPVRLDRFEVTGIRFEESVNPLTRPMEGLFGDLRGILETPRAVSLITPALLRERGVEGVR